MKNFNRIVGGAAAGKGFITDQTGIPDTSNVYSVPVKIIMTPLFAGQLTDTINRRWGRIRVLGTIFFWRILSKNRYAAWPENLFYALFPGNFQGIDEALHIEMPRKHRILFSCSREHGNEQIIVLISCLRTCTRRISLS